MTIVSTSPAVVVESCLSAAEGADGETNLSQALQCIFEQTQKQNEEDVTNVQSGLDNLFLIYAGSLLIFMQAGFAMLCAGSVRRKNVQNTMMKNLLDACGAGAAYFMFGYAFCYGGTSGPIHLYEDSADPATSFIGSSNFFLVGLDHSLYSFWFQQFAFSATAATIVAGTLAERSQMVSYFFYSLMLSGFVLPIVARQVWTLQGFLCPFRAEPFLQSGMVDFAGSAVVHTTGGVTALIASVILGPRRDRFRDEKGNLLKAPKRFQGYSVSLQVLGTFILWFGWYGFNAGSMHSISNEISAELASLSTVNTTIGAAFGAISALFIDALQTKRRTGDFQLDTVRALNGCLTGLVSVTGGAALWHPWASCVVGIAAGMIYLGSIQILNRFRVDDAVEAINVHLFGGILGTISPALFAAPEFMMGLYGRDDHVGLFYEWGRGTSSAHLLAANLVGMLFIFGFVLVTMTPFFLLLNCFGLFRADALEEIVGLDVHYSGGDSPDVINMGHLKALREQMNKRALDEETSEQEEEEQELEDSS